MGNASCVKNIREIELLFPLWQKTTLPSRILSTNDLEHSSSTIECLGCAEKTSDLDLPYLKELSALIIYNHCLRINFNRFVETIAIKKYVIICSAECNDN